MGVVLLSLLLYEVRVSTLSRLEPKSMLFRTRQGESTAYGVKTGRCGNTTGKVCEVEAWCPIQPPKYGTSKEGMRVNDGINC